MFSSSFKSPFRSPFISKRSLILDTYSGAAAAYSLRRLSRIYTGDAIVVRRSSDNAEQDIGFDANGDLDVDALATFVGANDGYVTTWYDQSGNGNHVTQPTAAWQPHMVYNGVLETSGGLPAVNFRDSGLEYAPALVCKDEGRLNTFRTGAFGAFSVAQYQNSLRNWQAIWAPTDLNTANGCLCHQFLSNSFNKFGSHNSNLSATSVAQLTLGTPTDRYQFTLLRDDAGINGNGSNVTGAAKSAAESISATDEQTWSSSTSGRHPLSFQIGRQWDPATSTTSVHSWKGYIQEVLLFEGDQSANSAAIEDNINNYYEVY